MRWFPNSMLTAFLGLACGFVLLGVSSRWLVLGCNLPRSETSLQANPRPVEGSPAKPPPAPNKPRLEVVFVLDTTGSMGGLLQGAKDKIWSIASRLAQGDPAPELRVGLVGFRDREDAYVTRVHPLTADLDQVYADLAAFHAAGGGDTPEDLGQAIRDAVNMPWSTEGNVLRLMYIVGDAPPKRYPNGPLAADWVHRAQEQGIVVSTVQCGRQRDTGRAFQALAQAGGGSFIRVRQNGGMAKVSTPFDEEISKLEREAADLALYGGSARSRREAKAKTSALATMDASAVADRAAYLSAKGFGTGGGGLADAAATGVVDLTSEPEAVESMPDDVLPVALRPLSKDERKAELSVRRDRRQALKKRVEKLAQERNRYLETAAPEADGMDGRVLEDVAKRAAEIGVSYK